jgi:hypothetical protein
MKDLRLAFGLLSHLWTRTEKTMKPLLLSAVILCSAAAFGQASALSNQVTPIQIVDHPLHASLTPMACERPLVGGAPDTYSYAQGERPLWEFGPVSEPVSLGDVARAYRKEKGSAKKAELVLEKQGS